MSVKRKGPIRYGLVKSHIENNLLECESLFLRMTTRKKFVIKLTKNVGAHWLPFGGLIQACDGTASLSPLRKRAST